MIIDTNNIPPDMAGSTIKMLCYLAAMRGVRPTDITRELGITPAGGTSLVDRAEAAGLVMRDRFPGDRRCQTILLTDHGLNVVAAMRPDEETLAAATEKHATLEVAR